MDERNNAREPLRNGATALPVTAPSLHPAWVAFIRHCAEMGYGEIERLKIQDGIPVLVEVSRHKIRFT